MTTREIVCDAFDSTIDGIAKRCEVDGDKRTAVEVAGEVLDITNDIVAAIADDGKMDEDEKSAIKAKFREGLAKRIPEESFWFLGTVWGIVKKWLKSIQDKICSTVEG